MERKNNLKPAYVSTVTDNKIVRNNEIVYTSREDERDVIIRKLTIKKAEIINLLGEVAEKMRFSSAGNELMDLRHQYCMLSFKIIEIDNKVINYKLDKLLLTNTRNKKLKSKS